MLAAVLAGLAVAAPAPSSVRTLLLPDGAHLEAHAPAPRAPRLRLLPDALQTLPLHGPAPWSTPDRQLDLVVLSEAYTAGEQARFEADARAFVTHLLSLEPWSTFPDLLAVRAVFVPSADAVLDDLEGEDLRRTAFECTYGCGLEGVATSRLVCCDEPTVIEAATRTGEGTDGILVLSADPRFGGSGGATYAVAYTGDDEALRVQAHEVSHTLVQLWDEYELGVAVTPDDLPRSPNCAAADAALPWHRWLAAAVDWTAWHAALDAGDPTACDGRALAPGEVCAFPGCSFPELVRPTADACTMRSLQDRWCPVCQEAIVRRLYRALGEGFVLEVDPDPTRPVVLGDAPTTFTATVPHGDLPLAWSWTLDDLPVGTGSSLTLERGALGGGLLRVEVRDASGFVRSDPGGVAVRQQTWQVEDPGCTGCATGSGGLGHVLLPLLILPLRRRRR
ncbi:MAG: hypothetical protein H6732_01410 [Alphaproteobacteria bacterium]|nr:hypothetical protein [Alphaproteobacteria bacterium]